MTKYTPLSCPYCEEEKFEFICKDVKYELKIKRRVPNGAIDLGIVHTETGTVYYDFVTCCRCQAKYGRGYSYQLRFDPVCGIKGRMEQHMGNMCEIQLIPDNKALENIVISLLRKEKSAAIYSASRCDYKILKIDTIHDCELMVESSKSYSKITRTVWKDSPTGDIFRIDKQKHEVIRVTGEEKPSKCFFATAAYGSPYSSEVKALKEYRDKYILRSASGKFFVLAYYFISPKIAPFIESSKIAKFLTKLIILKPILLLIRTHFFPRN